MSRARVAFDNPATVPAPAGSYSRVARIELDDGALLVVSGSSRSAKAAS